ncbi:MAG: hypothetical protein KGD57_02280, partial [Candidatus Lokiarchaeota archaeon]|nr:hypothetical protein [Candidatus Lokiarchaeota archaeon]
DESKTALVNKEEEISNLNAYIDDLKKKLSANEKELDSLKSENIEIKSRIEELSSENESLKSQTDEKEKNISELTSNIEKKKKSLEETSTKLEEAEAELSEYKPPEMGSGGFKREERVSCPMCSAVGQYIKTVEDKSKVLSYVGHIPMYAKKNVCKKCGYEF